MFYFAAQMGLEPIFFYVTNKRYILDATVYRDCQYMKNISNSKILI